jgi:Flp pilus assembly pilin Flp
MRGPTFRFLADERGATALEYGLIAALCCVAALAAFTAFGAAGSGLINGAMTAIKDAIAGA